MIAKVQTGSAGHLTKRQRLWRDIKRYRWVYLMALPAIVYFCVFCYQPMYGATLAFKKFSFKSILSVPYSNEIARMMMAPDVDIEGEWTTFIENYRNMWEPVLNELNAEFFGK